MNEAFIPPPPSPCRITGTWEVGCLENYFKSYSPNIYTVILILHQAPQF